MNRPIGTIVKAEPIVVSKREQIGCCLLWTLFSIAMVVGLIMVV